MGKSLNFDGSTAYLNGNLPSSITSSPFMQAGAFSAWVKVPASPSTISNTGIIIWNALNSGQDEIRFGYRTTAGDERFYMSAFAAAWSSTKGFSRVRNIKGLGWHHVGFSWNASINNSLFITLDGIDITDPSFGGSPSGTFKSVGNMFRLGSLTSGANFWQGNLDEVRLWGSALTLSQMRGIYLSNTIPSGDIQEYLFDDTASPATDSSGNGNNLTVNNATYDTDTEVLKTGVNAALFL